MSLRQPPDPGSEPLAPPSTEFVAAIVASSDDAIIATTLDGTIVHWNAAAARIYGYPAAEMIGRPLASITPADEVDEMRETLALVAAGARVEPFDAVRVHQHGRVLDVSVTVSPILDARSAIVGASWIERDVTGRRHVERMISHLAFHDPLTGLANRTLLADRLQNSLERTRRAGGMVAVVYLDLDDFKQVNDRHGHDAGDHVLVMLAQQLRDVVRAEDTVARLGGEEFALLLPETTLERALAVAERARAALEASGVRLTGGRWLSVTASFGAADFPASPDRASLLRDADQALYAAKRHGKNRIVAAARTADAA